jgi:hypothetical protein
MCRSLPKTLGIGKNGPQVIHDAKQHVGGYAIFVTSLPGPPIETSALIRENGAGGGAVGRQHHLEGIALDLVGNGAKPCKARAAVETGLRDDERRALAGLLVTGLWVKVELHDVAGLGNVGRHQTSRPRGRPVSHSSGRVADGT